MEYRRALYLYYNCIWNGRILFLINVNDLCNVVIHGKFVVYVGDTDYLVKGCTVNVEENIKTKKYFFM